MTKIDCSPLHSANEVKAHLSPVSPFFRALLHGTRPRRCSFLFESTSEDEKGQARTFPFFLFPLWSTGTPEGENCCADAFVSF